MNTETTRWPLLLGLQQQMQQARDEAGLCFLIANETWHLLPYSQACVFVFDPLGRLQLKAVSGLISTLEDTPFTLWLQQVAAACERNGAAAQCFTAATLDSALQDGWAEWWPAHACCQQLTTPHGRRLGLVLYVRNEAWQEDELGLLAQLHRSYAYCLATFRRPHASLKMRWQALRAQPRRLRLLALAIAALLCFPVRLSLLAPAEIIALKAEAVSAPSDGVIQTFHVQPNQPVKQGQLLFSLNGSTLRNRSEIARQTLEVARADALTAGQKAFDSLQSKAELSTLQGRVSEKEAELAYLEESLSRTEVRASHDGVLVYGDPNDWMGKPVITGERIAQLAQPDKLGVLVWIPVGDAIAMEAGADIKVYLQASPLNALSATLVQTSYQATLSPDNVASYRVRGQLQSGESAHIGLRGVAKVYGEWQPLVYWVLRRPLGALRQWSGV
ncbi:efflux RND transporter periplasmic adaptor subunit [Craterilacuibacter sp.]|uniref:efflux RND transporter periplasmic adaptor subunit n=1 Tax=Craterilacuibacter sp. TaxID=2870909 RepID=UPI003F3511CF